MQRNIVLSLALALSATSVAVAEPPPATPPPVHRQALLSAALATPALVRQVKASVIEFTGATDAPLHQHPCPVVGLVLEGSIRFQVAGRPEQILAAGDAFFEPADPPIVHFDNSGPGRARFAAFYLVGTEADKLIRLLR